MDAAYAVFVFYWSHRLNTWSIFGRLSPPRPRRAS